jgi:ssDNA-binding Zn-finger/Zn-ribbon topoisomerase 1
MVGELKEGGKKQKRLLEHRRNRVFIVGPSNGPECWGIMPPTLEEEPHRI